MSTKKARAEVDDAMSVSSPNAFAAQNKTNPNSPTVDLADALYTIIELCSRIYVRNIDRIISIFDGYPERYDHWTKEDEDSEMAKLSAREKVGHHLQKMKRCQARMQALQRRLAIGGSIAQNLPPAGPPHEVQKLWMGVRILLERGARKNKQLEMTLHQMLVFRFIDLILNQKYLL